MTDTYTSDIARAADNPRISPAIVRNAQAAMCARHRIALAHSVERAA